MAVACFIRYKLSVFFTFLLSTGDELAKAITVAFLPIQAGRPCSAPRLPQDRQQAVC
jgi:hypothetical protein